VGSPPQQHEHDDGHQIGGEGHGATTSHGPILPARLCHDAARPYSWWSSRGKAFDVDSGWRIDYRIASPGLAALAAKAPIDRAPSYAERWSDHAAVVVRYDLPAAPPRPVEGRPVDGQPVEGGPVAAV